jgi:hypothetical protein
VAGVKAEGQHFLAALQARNYSEACEALTATSRASFAREPGGCPGTVPGLYLRLSTVLSRWFNRVLPKIQVRGDTALYHGVVEARYEHGGWHLENRIW